MRAPAPAEIGDRGAARPPRAARKRALLSISGDSSGEDQPTDWAAAERAPAGGSRRLASERRAHELDLQLQRESVALEREKVRLERDKLALEREEIGIKRARVEHASRCSSSSASASETQWR